VADPDSRKQSEDGKLLRQGRAVPAPHRNFASLRFRGRNTRISALQCEGPPSGCRRVSGFSIRVGQVAYDDLMAPVEVENVSESYPRRIGLNTEMRPVVQNVSLQIEPGETLAWSANPARERHSSPNGLGPREAQQRHHPC